MDSADEAHASVVYYQTPQQPSIVRHWDILVQLGGVWMELKVKGSPMKATDKIEKYIDPLHDRWARGYNGECTHASGPEAVEAWNKVFGKKPASTS